MTIPPAQSSGTSEPVPSSTAEQLVESLAQSQSARASLAAKLERRSQSRDGGVHRSYTRLTPQQLLAQRAEQLARTTPSESSDEDMTLLIMQAGDERYGLEVHEAQEILVLDRITPLPGIASHWAGLINLRGRLYPILDLAAFLGLTSAPTKAGGRAVLVGRGDFSIGLLVASATNVIHVRRTQLGPSMSSTLGISREVIRGVTSDSVSILSVEALLSDPRLEVQDEV